MRAVRFALVCFSYLVPVDQRPSRHEGRVCCVANRYVKLESHEWECMRMRANARIDLRVTLQLYTV